MFALKDFHLPTTEELIQEKARKHLLDFTLYTKDDYRTNWHHKIFADKLMDVVNNKCKRLIIQVPPRMGKSELVSRRFPAYCLGLNPDFRIISCSYAADLATQFNRDCQMIMTSDEYRTLFPETRLNEKNVRTSAKGSYRRNADVFDVVGHKGYYKSSGRGSLTGFGGNILLLDDPIRDYEEAISPVIRDKVWNWYNSVFQSRKQACTFRGERFEPAIIIVLTRWSEDDPVGRLLDINPDPWEIISFPAILDEEPCVGDPRQLGESIWPDETTVEAFMEIKQQAGSLIWNSLYQQRPTAEGGDIIKKDWWRFYDEMPDPSEFDFIMASWDMAFARTTTSDYVVGQVWGKVGNKRYLLHQVRERMDFNEMLAAVRQVDAEWPLNEIMIEKKANGDAVITSLKNEIPGLTVFNPSSSKESRVQAISPIVEAGNVLLPRNADWLHSYLKEFADFPKGKHDDVVDATSQALIKMSTGYKWIEGIKGLNKETEAEKRIRLKGDALLNRYGLLDYTN